MDSLVDFALLERLAATAPTAVERGRITAVDALLARAELPRPRPGGLVEVAGPDGPTLAEIARAEGHLATLAPLTPFSRLAPGAAVTSRPDGEVVLAGPGLIGRVVDALGAPLDDRGPLDDVAPTPLDRAPPAALSRQPVDAPLPTGVRALDALATLGRGQRIALIAGPGVGKSTLLGRLATDAACDVCVVALVGERGREARDFVARHLGPRGRGRTVVVLAPAEAPPAAQVRALFVATAIAEAFRDEGREVLLLVDSLTRAVRARREIALALGEAPARSGFPSSSFAFLPRLIERAGRAARGAITSVYTVLAESAEDAVADEVRSLTDGHWVLDARRARAGMYPAVDPLASVSRVQGDVLDAARVADQNRLRRLIAALEESRDLVLMGAYRRGTAPLIDLALERQQEIETFLCQDAAATPFDDTFARLAGLVREAGGGEKSRAGPAGS